MLSCAFFGHSNFHYEEYRDKIKERVIDLINRGVTIFYNGFRGNFDRMCAHIVSDLREEYPQIKNVLVLSYRDTVIDYPEYFDEAVYLLDKKVPFRFAISHTNRRLVETVDYIISGVTRVYGGAKAACDYAERLYRTIFYIVDDYSNYDYDHLKREWEEEMKDEKVRKQFEEDSQRLYEKIAPVVEANIAKLKNKKRKTKEYHPPVWVTVETKKTTED